MRVVTAIMPGASQAGGRGEDAAKSARRCRGSFRIQALSEQRKQDPLHPCSVLTQAFQLTLGVTCSSGNRKRNCWRGQKSRRRPKPFILSMRSTANQKRNTKEDKLWALCNKPFSKTDAQSSELQTLYLPEKGDQHSRFHSKRQEGEMF